jgi:integrase
MPVHKYKRNGKVTWFYKFDMPGSSRGDREIIQKSGFATRGEAVEAEGTRRIEEQQKREFAKAGSGVAAAPPKTLEMLLQEFHQQHAQEKLAPKTVERYREMGACLDPGLLAMPLVDVRPLHLSREWTRLLKSGGHHRRTKERRPLSAKTVRLIAGMVSSAFNRAVIWGLVAVNPVRASEPPKPKKRRAAALTLAQQEQLIAGACGPWCMKAILQIAGFTALRRGELLALRWSDIHGSLAEIEQSLTQTKDGGVAFKSTKTEEPRTIVLPGEALLALEDHRQQQDAFRQQYGASYHREHDLIFCNPDGTPLKPDSVSGTVSRMFRTLKIAKPKGDALHILRHTHCSEMLDNGAPVAVVSARLGHKSIRTTLDIYGHMIHGQEEEAVRRWEARRKERRLQEEQSRVVN